jgi:WD40 repeat protein
LEFIKDEIDLRIDSLISKLNEYRDDLFKQIENTKEYGLNELLINDKINEIKSKYKCEDNVTINDYSKYELKLKQLENEINKLNSYLPLIQFKSCENDINMDIIGDFRIVKDQLFFDDFSGKTSIRLSDRRLAVYHESRYNDSIYIYNYDNGIAINELEGHSERVTSLAELPNKRLASGSNDSTIKIWDLNTFTCIKTLNEHIDWIVCLKNLPNNRLASGSEVEDRTIKIWDIDNYECISTLSGHSQSVNCLEYISNNRLVSSGHNVINIWNLNDNCLINTIEGHTTGVTCLKRISDNQIASGGHHGIIKIWNTDDYNCINTLGVGVNFGPPITFEAGFWCGSIECIILISNNRLVCGSDDNTIKVWNMNDNSLIKTFNETNYNYSQKCLISLSNENGLVGVAKWEYKIWDMSSYKCIEGIYLMTLEDRFQSGISGTEAVYITTNNT